MSRAAWTGAPVERRTREGRRLARLAGLAALAVTLGACAHSIHEVHVSDFDGVPAAGGKRIEARSEQFVVLGFKGDTKYVEQAYARLQDACKGGRIQGITTQFSTSLGFLSYTNKILMQGLCSRG